MAPSAALATACIAGYRMYCYRMYCYLATACIVGYRMYCWLPWLPHVLLLGYRMYCYLATACIATWLPHVLLHGYRMYCSWFPFGLCSTSLALALKGLAVGRTGAFLVFA